MKWFYGTEKCENKGFLGQQTWKAQNTWQHGNESRKQREKKVNWNMPQCDLLCTRIFPSLKVYLSQRNAFRMHTCGATVIHIKTSCGDDCNQKTQVHTVFVLFVFTKHNCSRSGRIYCRRNGFASPQILPEPVWAIIFEILFVHVMSLVQLDKKCVA